MKTRINTLSELADFINGNEEWVLEVERIIEENGWVSDCGTTYGICHNGNEYLELNEGGNAVIVMKKHDIEFVDYTEGWLTYLANGKQIDVSGEFFKDKNGVYHHSHIFEDGVEIEVTWK